MKTKFLCLFIAAAALSCVRGNPSGDPSSNPSADPSSDISLEEILPVSEDLGAFSFFSDKSRYDPGAEVTFYSAAGRTGLGVRYWHLGEVVGQEALSSPRSWSWTPPSEDYTGYMAEVVAKDASGALVSLGTCAVDVSSTWTRFPRYGYLSRFGNVSVSEREKVLANLNKHHINGLQYYEWGYDHHHPLCGTPENPAEEWDKYLTGTTCRLDVIRGYIDSGHKYNMASMFYDLNNGVFEWCEEDGCGYDWYTYTDPDAKTKDCHPLNVPPWRSILYLVDPNLDAWNEYFAKQIDDVYKVFDFDGFHIDQLGNRGTIYDYYGKQVDLRPGYGKIINTMKKAQPTKNLVFNAVSQYGQEIIAASPVDFLYNEVWDLSFGAIKSTLDYNYSVDPSKNTVLAAYIHDKNDGYFNTPAVLLTDAVMFAMGASHIELGETLICHIYWPSCKMALRPELEEALVEYYDFLTAYENVLRDGGKEARLSVTSGDIPISYWGPSMGNVNVYAKSVSGGRTAVHLINFKDAVHLNWRDDARNQAEPSAISDFTLTIPTMKKVGKVWAASPDRNGGAPENLEYTLSSDGTKVSVKVPYLKYWTMIVVE